MITVTIKILLEIIMIVCFGYLTLAFFQKLFCKDISRINYSNFIHDRRIIWKNFRRALTSNKYRSFVMLCILCLFGFYNSLHELSLDWQLKDKLMLWQIWAILFCYAVYLSHTNMKLKLIYDISGKDHKQAKIIPMDTPNTAEMKKQMTAQIKSVIDYKNAFKYIIAVLILAILCAGYAFFALRKAEKSVQKERQYGVSRDSIITNLNNFKDSINTALDQVTRERDSLLIIRTAKSLEREDILKKPIDYSNDKERKQILDQMIKETKE